MIKLRQRCTGSVLEYLHMLTGAYIIYILYKIHYKETNLNRENRTCAYIRHVCKLGIATLRDYSRLLTIFDSQSCQCIILCVHHFYYFNMHYYLHLINYSFTSANFWKSKHLSTLMILSRSTLVPKSKCFVTNDQYCLLHYDLSCDQQIWLNCAQIHRKQSVNIQKYINISIIAFLSHHLHNIMKVTYIFSLQSSDSIHRFAEDVFCFVRIHN